MDREKLLRDYRSKKKKEEMINDYKDRVKSLFVKKKTSLTEEPQLQSQISIEEKEPFIKQQDDLDVKFDVAESVCSDFSETECCDNTWNSRNTTVNIFYYLLWFILWATLFAVFVELEFGMIYLIVSAFVGMYINTRTSPKKPNEISAYSVFNKNCESIDGTLKAEQLERQLLYGVGGLR